jgi:glycosyltransferase involved in cell wall biosynthesis
VKVVFLAPELLPNYGGVGTYSVEILRQLCPKVDFTILTPLRRKGPTIYDRKRIEEYFGNRVRVEVISEANDTFLYNASFQWQVLRHLHRLYRGEEFDLVHSQHAHMPDLLSGPVQHEPPTIRTVHTTIKGQREGIEVAQRLGEGLEPAERWQLALRPLLSSAEWATLSRRRDTYITVSRWMRELLVAEGFPPVRTHVIHCGVDINRFRPDLRDEQAYGRSPMEKVVLFPGRPTVVKGAAVLGRAMPEILRQVPNARFLFVGGTETDFLRLVSLPSTVRERSRFLGYVPFDELPRVYASSDLVVAPTYYENFPIRILEALGSGVPVVASRVGGIPEAVLPGVTGDLVDPGNPGQLAEAVARILAADDRRKAMGSSARALVSEQFTWAQAATKTLELYRSVVKGGSDFGRTATTVSQSAAPAVPTR